jgi:hypothetical protein
MVKIVISIFLALFASLGAHSQSRTVNGLLLDRDMSPVWAIHIYINDSVKVGETDAKGNYEVTIPVGVDSIIFRGVGFEPLLVRLAPGCSRVEAIMVLAGSYDFMSPAKVDRQRLRYFNKITKLYSVAVQKGHFASDPICHKAIFQRDVPRKKEMHRQWLRKQHSAQQQL